ncbi:MAG TPA: hypothetical protein VKH35_15815, partial [Thermoanaerobaculia bacterium]|nr:hypothetical protein [Thermoanaerobaculia bacterium]
LLLFLSAAIRMRKGQTTPGHITAGVFSWFLTIVASAVIGGAAAWIVSLRTPSAVWSAQPGPSIAAMWLIGAATAMICAKPFYARAGFDGLFFGHGLCWCAASFGAVVMLPGGSDLVVVPAIVFALAAALRATLALSPARAVVLTSAAAAVLWFPVIIRLYEIMGRPTLGLIAVTVAIVSTTFTPVAVSAGIRRAAVTAMYGTAAACIAMQLLIPVYTPDSPERIDVRYVDTEEGARWVVDHLTPAIRSHGPFRHVPPAWAPWLAQPAGGWAAPSPRVSAAPPELRVLRDDRGGRRQVTLLVRSMRGANAIALFFRAPELAGLSINGIAPPPPPQRFRSRLAPGWHAVNVIGQSAAQIEITLRRDEPIEVVVADHSRTLPPEAAPLLRARDRSIAVPSGEGDGMTVERRLVLK